MESYDVEFSGSILRRGFWIYVWHVTTGSGGQMVYVGRTGDTSSPNAQSPFRRIGQHVDPNPKSKSNALARNLRKNGIDPVFCHFKFTALGPIYEERQDMKSHVPFRNKAAALERKTADWFRDMGYEVLGSHPRRRNIDENVWRFIEDELKIRFAVGYR